MENMLLIILRSFGEKRKAFLNNIPLLKKIKKANDTYEISVILDYITYFGEERYLSILNNPKTYKVNLKIEDFRSMLQPVVCDGIKHHFFEARVNAFSDYWHRNDTFEMKLEREPDNRYDKNAIKVLAGSTEEYHIGYVPRDKAEIIAPMLDRGFKSVIISDIEDYVDDDCSYPIKIDISVLKYK